MVGNRVTATVGIFANIFQGAADQLRALDAGALAVFGFAIGVYGILVHPLADILTMIEVRFTESLDVHLSEWAIVEMLEADADGTLDAGDPYSDPESRPGSPVANEPAAQ